MIWLFVSVVLILLVLHPGFRRAAMWFGGGAAVVLVAGAVVLLAKDRSNPDPLRVVPQTPENWVPPEVKAAETQAAPPAPTPDDVPEVASTTASGARPKRP